MTRDRASVLAVLSAMALVVLDSGLFNIALPVVANALNTTPASMILAVSTYQAALVIGLLPSAQIADRFGHRRLFIGGLCLFTAASIVCGFANGLPMLVAARFLQGLGGAVIMALGIALLRSALGSGRLGKAIGWNALTVALFSAAGPILGALVLTVATWPWLFFVKLPISIIALMASAALPADKPARRAIDATGIASHAATAVLVLIAVGLATSRPVTAVLLGSAAIVLAVVLFHRQMKHDVPLWPVDLLALRPFRIAVIASICCFAGQSAGLLALPFYLQLGLGHGPLGAGLVMTCWPLSVAVTSLFANRLAEWLGSARLCVGGGLVLGSGLALSAIWPARGGTASLMIGAVLCGIGFGLFQVANNRTLFLSAPSERSAAAGGMQGSARLIGQTLGALVMGLLFAGGSPTLAPRIGFALGAVFAIAAAAVSALEVRRSAVSPYRRQSLISTEFEGEVT